jgi:hypothetical protein
MALYDDVWTSLDSADLAELKSLITTYIKDNDKVDISAKDFYLDSISVLEAVIKADTATTNNSLKAALVAIDTLETSLQEKYKTDLTYGPLAEEFDIKSVNDSLLPAYIKAINEAAKDDKNQIKDIQTIITGTNAANTVKLVNAVNTAIAAINSY